MKPIVILVSLLLLFTACSTDSEPEVTREIKFNVAGMYCDGCVKAIDQRMKKFEGAENVSVTLADSSVIATFPESKVPSDEDLIKMLEEMGYSYIKQEGAE
jgi:copper chaperone CopZ